MKTFKELREGIAKKEDAVADFLAKGGKIKKLPPAKAQGYHGKDDPGKGMAGMMDKGDTKAIGTRKKVKSMEDDDTARMYKDNPEMMKKGGPGGYKGLNKAGKKATKKAMGEAKQTHMFDNEKDARAKAKEIGGKYVKGTGKSAGKHAAIKELSKKTLGSYIKKATADVDNKSYVQGKVDQGFQDYKKDQNAKLNQRRRGIDKAADKLTKEAKEISELSPDLLNRYKDKANKDYHDKVKVRNTATGKKKADALKKSVNRHRGIGSALKRDMARGGDGGPNQKDISKGDSYNTLSKKTPADMKKAGYK